jgi:DNA (cytosine-5)-methyltransferase 1
VPLTAVDLFAGAGGATQGLRDAGFDVVAAVELESDAATTWALNHPGVMLEADVRTISSGTLMAAGGLGRGDLDLLKACPPCQGFSTLRGARVPDEERNDLVLDTLRLVDELQPRSVLLENVPGLRKDGRFARLCSGMRTLGYSLRDYIVEADQLGVPQRRRRLVVIAVRNGEVPPEFDVLIPPADRRPLMTAGEALSALPADPDSSIASSWRKPSKLVAERIEAVPVNGTRFDLPVDLQLSCHKKLTSKSGAPSRSAASSYGRIRADRPAPTMTTRCTTPACGSFIHPTEHRGISLREAAAFQTFPVDYRWAGSYGSVERQIGNAVPVWMAEALGKAVASLLSDPNPTLEHVALS